MATRPKKIVKYETTALSGDVPHSRNGKHHGFIGSILADLESLKPGMAMKIPLKELLAHIENPLCPEPRHE